MEEFVKQTPLRCRLVKKKAYGNVYEYPYFEVTIPSKVVNALDLSTNDMLEFHVLDDGETVECSVGFIFAEPEDEEEEYMDATIEETTETQEEEKPPEQATPQYKDEGLNKIIQWIQETQNQKEE